LDTRADDALHILAVLPAQRRLRVRRLHLEISKRHPCAVHLLRARLRCDSRVLRHHFRSRLHRSAHVARALLHAALLGHANERLLCALSSLLSRKLGS
jgi:hypothetical protein